MYPCRLYIILRHWDIETLNDIDWWRSDRSLYTPHHTPHTTHPTPHEGAASIDLPAPRSHWLARISRVSPRCASRRYKNNSPWSSHWRKGVNYLWSARHPKVQGSVKRQWRYRETTVKGQWKDIEGKVKVKERWSKDDVMVQWRFSKGAVNVQKKDNITASWGAVKV